VAQPALHRPSGPRLGLEALLPAATHLTAAVFPDCNAVGALKRLMTTQGSYEIVLETRQQESGRQGSWYSAIVGL